MSMTKLLLSELHRRHSISSLSRLLTLQSHHFQNHILIPQPTSPQSLSPFPSNNFHFKSNPNFFDSSNFFNIRSYSSRSSSPSDDSKFEDHGIEFAHEPLLLDSEISNSAISAGLEVVDKVIGTGDNMIFPVRAAISFIEGVHDFTGFPWWLTIATSTVIFRLTLLPFLVFQLHKLAKIAELFPELPPLFPPPLSGRSLKDQLLLIQEKKKALGCPSFLWSFALFAVQFPCFLVWFTSFRRMALDHHPGFDCGGALWFQNLSESPTGVLGPILPIIIFSLYFTNVQISFSKLSSGGRLGLLVKWYENFLKLMSVFLLYGSFQMPQASLVYWVTNLSFSNIQLVTLRHPTVRELLGLPNKETSERMSDPDVFGTIQIRSSDQPTKLQEVSVKELSPKELLAVSVQMLAKGHQDKAIPLLRLALHKDPECVRALTVMGQTLIQKGLLTEAIEHLERAIAKLFLTGHPTKLEDIDMLIIASQWAGVAHVRQGQFAEGLVHLERIAQLKEPEDPNSKVHYFDGLLLLASTLSNVSRSAEAANYMRRVAAYNPDYGYLVEQCENEGNDFTGDLTSRRRDYSLPR